MTSRFIGGMAPALAVQTLFVLRNADLQSTADQIFTRIFAGSAYRITDMFARQRSGAGSVTCLGGVYDQPSKGGNALVSALQSWVSLATNIIVTPVLAGINNTALLTGTPYSSLTTGSTGPCTADIFIYGVDLS